MKGRSDGDHSRIVNHALVPAGGTFDLDPAHTFVGFSAQHLVVGRVRGRFQASAGHRHCCRRPAASTVEASIRDRFDHHAESIRDDDLRSEHYLDVERYPTMTFRSTAATS